MTLKIDCYTHYASPNLMKFLASEQPQSGAPFQALFDQIPILMCRRTSDIQARVAYMKKAGVICQVLIPLPWIEACPTVWNDPDKAARACRIANEEMAKFCSEVVNGCCFVGVALLPTVNEKVMMQEYNYAIHDLKLAGSVLFFGPQTTPSDDPLFETLYRESEKNNTPIWLHPSRPQSYPDYDKYKDLGSMHAIWNSLGWVYDTSVAMVHIALSGVLQRYPNLKVVGHHGGGMIPFFTERFSVQTSNFGSDLENKKFNDLKKFYVDTATFGYQPANISQCLDFFNEGHVLYGTDTPMDMSSPGMFTETACKSINDLGLSQEDLEKVYFKNSLVFLGQHAKNIHVHLGIKNSDQTNMQVHLSKHEMNKVGKVASRRSRL